jgi:hypothetical protein
MQPGLLRGGRAPPVAPRCGTRAHVPRDLERGEGAGPGCGRGGARRSGRRGGPEAPVVVEGVLARLPSRPTRHAQPARRGGGGGLEAACGVLGPAGGGGGVLARLLSDGLHQPARPRRCAGRRRGCSGSEEARLRGVRLGPRPPPARAIRASAGPDPAGGRARRAGWGREIRKKAARGLRTPAGEVRRSRRRGWRARSSPGRQHRRAARLGRLKPGPARSPLVIHL